MTKEATKLGVAGLLVVAPYYNRPPQSGIEAHVRAVAEASHLPVVVYDIPVRTGRKINTSTLLKLAREVKNVVALKDAAGNPAAGGSSKQQHPRYRNGTRPLRHQGLCGRAEVRAGNPPF